MDIQEMAAGTTAWFRKLAGLRRYDGHLHARKWLRLLRYLAGGGSLPVFTELVLETTADCNRRCSFCPVSINPRGTAAMDETLFAKALNELATMGYTGRIALHFFNEPLLDGDIVTKVRRLAEAAPRASIEIYSNGDLLSPALFARLVDAGLSFMLATAYSDNALRRLEAIHRQLNWRQRSRLVLRRAPDFNNNRAGSLDQFAIPEPLAADCFQPAYRLVINYKGQAVICTNDYYAKVVVGQFAEQTLLDIWRGPALREVRETLRRKERSALAACSGCNSINTPLRSYEVAGPALAAFNQQAAGGQAPQPQPIAHPANQAHP